MPLQSDSCLSLCSALLECSGVLDPGPRSGSLRLHPPLPPASAPILPSAGLHQRGAHLAGWELVLSTLLQTHKQRVLKQINKVCFLTSGHANASFCPHAYGCRDVLVSENQIILDVTDNEVFLTVQIPAGKTLWLVSSMLLFISAAVLIPRKYF